MAKASSSLFGSRLRAIRLRAGLAQDKLGVLIGLDEACSSARISRYESGTHAPPFRTAELLAAVLGVPPAYFYCSDEPTAELILLAAKLPAPQQERLLMLARELAGSGGQT